MMKGLDLHSREAAGAAVLHLIRPEKGDGTHSGRGIRFAAEFALPGSGRGKASENTA